MARSKTLFTGQWADISLTELAKKISDIGYDGLELACWGDHFDLSKLSNDYCDIQKQIFGDNNLQLFALSNHLVGQAVCDNIDLRHKAILPDYIWKEGDPESVRQRAAEEMIKTAEAAKMMGVNVVNGFTGSSIWHLLYSFPPVTADMIDEGFGDFAKRWKPILDEYQKLGVKFALEVHPTEIAFDIASTQRALEALDFHPAFGFNFDASHLGYQGVDYIKFIHQFANRIFHVHIKDVRWSQSTCDVGMFGGHTEFGDYRRFWDFCSVGRGNIDFEAIIRTLNHIQYSGPLSIEWEDSAMDRFFGAKEALDYINKVDFEPSSIAFDDAFKRD